jgi:hypothetical protein
MYPTREGVNVFPKEEILEGTSKIANNSSFIFLSCPTRQQTTISYISPPPPVQEMPPTLDSCRK